MESDRFKYALIGGLMRLLLILAVAVAPAIAQGPVVRLTNATRPARNDFQIGDRFEIAITGAARQPVSVRTTMKGRTNWGPVIGWTDMGGRWATTGQFEKGDFGDWSEVWTVGGKLAKPRDPVLRGRAMPEGWAEFRASERPQHGPDLRHRGGTTNVCNSI